MLTLEMVCKSFVLMHPAACVVRYAVFSAATAAAARRSDDIKTVAAAAALLCNAVSVSNKVALVAQCGGCLLKCSESHKVLDSLQIGSVSITLPILSKALDEHFW